MSDGQFSDNGVADELVKILSVCRNQGLTVLGGIHNVIKKV